MSSGSIPRTRLTPRKYQVEAFRWAYKEKRSVVVLPTGTGKTLIAVLWIKKLLEEGKARRVLVLEPTRLLVEQVAKYIRDVGELEAKPVHGSHPKNQRLTSWRACVVVATPEVFLADADDFRGIEFDAVVVDECHHTTGKDAYVEAMKRLSHVEYRLGLSAFIPRSRLSEIEDTIGKVRVWSWSDSEVAPYIPQWIGEVYEVELNESEKKVLEALENIRDEYVGKLRGLVQNAIRWFVRDGALALRDSLERETLLAKLLENIKPLVHDPKVRPAHKLDAFWRILRDHEGFSKAIVFIDRVAVAEYVYRSLIDGGVGAVLIRGRMRRSEVLEALDKARSGSVQVIVSTSAGEEGMDLPEADLLIMWSITASPLRFIQRHGRVLRAREGIQTLKFVAYIVTLDTVDVDSLVDAIETARRIGIDMPIEPQTIETLWRRTTRSKIIAVLEGNPMPIDWLQQVLGIPMNNLEKDLQRLAQHGDIVYIFTHLGKTYAYEGDIEILYERFGEYLEPDSSLRAKVKYVIEGSKTWSRTISGNYYQLFSKLLSIVERNPIERLLVSIEVEVRKGLIKLVNLVYSFRIDSSRKLELVLRNAFSVKKLVELSDIPVESS